MTRLWHRSCRRRRYWLIATRFPYLSVAQLNDVLATTELPSGGPLDNGTGWARLNLYAAAGGYGAFPNNVTVNMNAARGGLNAFDVWSNNISGPGGLTLQGSGTLILAGNNSYTGGTNVQGGTLAVTGSLLGPLAVSPGATFVLGNYRYIHRRREQQRQFQQQWRRDRGLHQFRFALRQRQRRFACLAPRLHHRARQFDRHDPGRGQPDRRGRSHLSGAGRR